MNTQSEVRVYYSDDPKLGFKTVKTVGGETEYRRNCKKIMDEYHVINKDCFYVGNQWFRVKSGLIVFDEETKQYVLKKDANLINGMIGYDKAKGPIMGYFSPNPYNNCKAVIGGGYYTVFNPDILIESGFVENFSTGVWQVIERGQNLTKLQTPVNAVDHRNKGYNIEDNAVEFEEKKRLFKEYKPQVLKGLLPFGKMLGDSTFGFEIECAKGFLPEHLQARTGVVICRDGSLRDEAGMPGPEYVTVPMGGSKALQTLMTLSKELTKRNKININCSFHIHMGSIPTTRIFLVTLFKLAVKLQNELFLMFPYYKANPEGIKSKNYNQKLPTLSILSGNDKMNKETFDEYVNSSYKKMFTWLAEGYNPDRKYNRAGQRHPVTHKWDRTKRYFWLNFMNTLFSDRNTVEFRLHTPTTNSTKMINWLFICNALVKYAMANSRKILTTKETITLNDVLGYYAKSFGKQGAYLTEYLSAYVEDRKERFNADYLKNDKVSKWDIEEDGDYVFNYKGNTSLF